MLELIGIIFKAQNNLIKIIKFKIKMSSIAQRRRAKKDPEGDAVRGEKLFKSHCAGCHANMRGIYGKPIASGNAM